MRLKINFTAAALIGVFAFTSLQAADSNSPLIQSDAAVMADEVKATVKNVDYKTRKVTLREANGEEFTFVAGENIKNFNQLRKGDVVTATYTEALVYEIKKGGKAVGMDETTMMKTARPGSKPGALFEQQVTASVLISAINEKVPSVTFKNAEGETKTVKVKDPKRLQGVKVGDTVDVTYMESLAIKVEKATKQ